jgi:N-acetylglucosaminyldiphosphoundecaprenol N-acetyl-beta-D-mannosaminyltransferase
LIDTISLLGQEFADLTVAQAASRIAERPANAPFSYVVTPNAHHLVRLTRDPRLRAAYRNNTLCLLDSRVVFGLARLIGLSVPMVVPGSDLTADLLAHHLRPGERVTIIGLSPLWLPALVARCGLAAPAHHNPPMGFDLDPEAFDAAVVFVQGNPSRFIFLAVGSPRQEYLAAAIETRGGATGTGLCIGASLEFLAGARRRPPRFMRRVGLEWLFRLVAEPRRLFRRYLIDSPAIIVLLLKQRAAAGRSARALRA